MGASYDAQEHLLSEEVTPVSEEVTAVSEEVTAVSEEVTAKTTAVAPCKKQSPFVKTRTQTH